MICKSRAGLAIAALLTAASPAALVSAQADPAKIAASASQDALKPEADIRFGVLANGMHYAIMHNATPKGQASLRLRIGSGSLEEADDQQGLAHFLEHMAFKGSTHVPEGEMIKILQRKGLAFGPDTNAFTAWTQTVYMLDLPETDADTLDTGLMLMRETGGELTIGARALEPERGVVLSEERLRDTPPYREFKTKLQTQLEGQLASRRMPIGQVEVIKSAPADKLAAFYHANYRPDRATLIAVGDFDLDLMEAKIRARFSDWAPVGPATAEPDLGKVHPRGPQTQLFVIPGAPNAIEMSWVQPYDTTPDSIGRRRQDTIDDLAMAVLNRRLETLSRSAAPPFLTAEVSFGSFLRSARVASLRATTSPEKWRDGLSAVEQEVRRLVQFGARPEELQREILDSRTSLKNAVDGADTRRTPDLAGGLVDALDDQHVFTSPAQDLALFDAAVKGLAVDDVNAAARRIFSGAGPLVQATTPTPLEGGDKTLADAYAASVATPVAAPAAEAAIKWPYSSFGAPGRAVSVTPIADLGVTQYVFANGVRLTVKPTRFQTDQVMVLVKIGSGRSTLPSDRLNTAWASQALPLGGLRLISQEDMERVLNGRTYEARFMVGDDGYTLEGVTKPADLDIQMQVLAAYASDAGWRDAAFERLRVAMGSALTQFEATASGVLSRDQQQLMTTGDKRYAYPDAAALAAQTPADFKTMLDLHLKSDPVEIVIVGDITEQQAQAAVAATFGALPKRPAPAPAKPNPLHFPAAAMVHETHKGRADQSIALAAWPTLDLYSNRTEARTTLVLQDILDDRLLAQVRVAEGATYSPQGEARPSEVYPGYGYIVDYVETPPDKIASFFANVSKITADLRNAPPTDDELTRAVKPRLERTLKAQQTNSYWLVRLSGSIADPRRLELVRTSLSDYQAVTPQDVQIAARKYLRDERAWKLDITAQPAAVVTK